MNKDCFLYIKGFLGKNPKLGVTKTEGKPFLRFSVGVQNVSMAGKPKTYSWHQCIVWGKFADLIAPVLIHRRPVIVTGDVRTNRYMAGGVHRMEQQVNVDSIYFIDREGLEHFSDLAIEAAKAGMAAAEDDELQVIAEEDLP